MSDFLVEQLNFENADIKLESVEDSVSKTKSLYMRGIFLQADVENFNKRIYPRHQIENAVKKVNEKIKLHGPLPGECAHPEGLTINIDRISHGITEMWMDGNNGCGKLKIFPTTLGNTIRVLLENGVKLGVSSRGSGEVDYRGYVSDYEIVTVDIVSQPSAPGAYPLPIYEQLQRSKNKSEIEKLSEAMKHDYKAQKYFKKELLTAFEDILKV